MLNFQPLIQHILHLDTSLITVAQAFGLWTYGILFLIIFCETGLVITPFLPGDSLLFATGALAAHPSQALNIHVLFILLSLASIFGNATNYMLGRFIGPQIFRARGSRLFNKNYLTQAHEFYNHHGGKTIILARFIPIIRTFGPFVAGIAFMSYRRFAIYNIISAVLWIGGLLYASYFFGNLPFIKQNFSVFILLIIGLSLLPPILTFCYRKFATANA